MFALPIPSDSMLRDTFKETQKWHTYKDRLSLNFSKDENGNAASHKEHNATDSKAAYWESQERKKELNHIEQLHENEEEAQDR